MSSPFTLTIDWLAFTLPSGSARDTMQMLGGDWTKSEAAIPPLGSPRVQAGGLANWERARPVLPSKCMSIFPPGLLRHGFQGRSARSFNGS